LWLKSEEFDWGILRDDLPNYLHSSGFEFLEVATPETFRTRYLKPEGLEHVTLADGEYVCLTEVAEPNAKRKKLFALHSPSWSLIACVLC
jgi:hypothetical protein